jgi:hypothetical protein
MDTKLIQQYGEDILCYGIRTARQKKRMQYEDFDKQLIQLHKEEKALRKQQRNLGWEHLIPPVQKGWKRFFVLREDVARDKQSVFFENILKKINTCDYSWRKDFKKRKRKYGRKVYVVKPQSLLKPCASEFSKMEFSEKEKQLFYEVWEMDFRRQLVKKFVFAEPWRFVLRIQPNMIDKVRKIDAVIEARLKEIDDYLERNDWRKKQCKLVHGYYKWGGWKEHEKYNEKSMFKNKSLYQILDLVKIN